MARASELPRDLAAPAADSIHGAARRLRSAALAAAAALLVYAAWRGYQNPDLILDLGVTLGLC